MRDVEGAGVADAKVTAALKDRGALVTRTDIMGVYKIPGFGKDIDPKDVTISCAKEGYKQANVSVGRISDPKDPIEIECYLKSSEAPYFAAALLLFPTVSVAARAQTLAGTVSSAAEGAMEGVLVSAQKAGSPITVTVVSDEHGRFRFPDGRFSPGITRCASARSATSSTARKRSISAPPTDIALKLRKTADLAAQLTNTEWFISMPGTPEQKRPLIECMSCHTFERIVRSTYNAEAFLPVLKRMAQYANNTTQAQVQSRLAEREVHDDLVRKLAAYLATVNLQRPDLALRAANLAAAEGPRHPCRHHRIRYAAQNDRAARRAHRCAG